MFLIENAFDLHGDGWSTMNLMFSQRCDDTKTEPAETRLGQSVGILPEILNFEV